MLEKILSAVCLAAAVFIAGCRTVLPPTFAVANLYPVVQPASVLKFAKPYSVGLEDLRRKMNRYGLLPYLEDACLPEYEWETVIRSLGSRGYAEVDARRTDRPLRTLCISSPDGRRLVLKAEFKLKNWDLICLGEKISLKQNQEKSVAGLQVKVFHKYSSTSRENAAVLQITE